MGGSGTRIVARVLREAGLFLGTNTNGVKEDALEFRDFIYRWVPPYLESRRRGHPLKDRNEMAREYAECVKAHRREMPNPDGPWGWKGAPAAHLLPFLADVFPRTRAIHVIRDGRDIAFGKAGGRTHTVHLGRAILDGDPGPMIPGTRRWKGPHKTSDGSPEATPARQARVWAVVNDDAADWGTTTARYLRIRLEDLVSQPSDVVATLVAFAGLARVSVEPLASLVSAPSTLGRWRQHSSDEIAEITRVIEPQLRRFGYVDANTRSLRDAPTPRPAARA